MLRKNLMLKEMNGKTPKYVEDLFNKKGKITSLVLRDNEKS